MKLPILLSVVAVLGAACASGTPDLPGVVVGSGFEIDVAASDLAGPTQFVVVDDERVLVATINGGEDDMQGQIVIVDEQSGESEVLVDQLDKPTGVALIDDNVWIMERNRLSTLGGIFTGAASDARITVLDDLPNNGRSEGTLTVTPDQHLLFNTSGTKRGADVVDGSGRLFTLDPSALFAAEQGNWTEVPVEVASGFKHAYAHTYDGDTLWTTEMSDGQFDGEPAADEILAVVAGADHGWPHCVGDNRPVAEYGGSAGECDAAPPSLVTFDPGASPTSVVVSPFDPDVLFVALWNQGRVVSVDTTSPEPRGYTDVVSGLVGPQHLVATNDAVYISEFGTGRILKLTN